MNSTSPLVIAPQSLAATSTTSNGLRPGSKAASRDGGEYVFVKNGAGAIAVGTVCQSSAQVAAHQNLAVVANVAVGATSLQVTNGATPITENQYAGGSVIVSGGAGLGQRLQIVGNTAAAGAAACTLSLAPDDAVRVALTSATS